MHANNMKRYVLSLSRSLLHKEVFFLGDGERDRDLTGERFSGVLLLDLKMYYLHLIDIIIINYFSLKPSLIKFLSFNSFIN